MSEAYAEFDMSTSTNQFSPGVYHLVIQLPAVIMAVVSVTIASLYFTTVFAVVIGLVVGVITASLVAVITGLQADGVD